MWAVVVAQVVAHLTMGQEVQGSNPSGSWAFSLISFSSVNQWCILYQIPQGGATQLILQIFP